MSDPFMPPPPTRQGLLARIVAILLKPSETWDVIADDTDSFQAVFTGYVMPLAAIGPVCRAIGGSLVGTGGYGGSRVAWLWSILAGVIDYALSLGMVCVLALVINALAPSFDGRKDRLRAFKLAAYAGTAGYLAGIVGLVPILWPLGLIGLYNIYLVYAGLPWLMRNPAARSLVYTAVVAVCGLVMALFVAAVASHLMTLGVRNRTDVGAPGAVVERHVSASSAGVTAASAPAPVRVADARELLALLPPLFNGAVRADTSTSFDSDISTAEATYTLGGGSIHLKIADAPTAAGLATSSASGTGDSEIVKTDGNRVTHESYDAAEKSGRYSVVQGGRISVEADASHVDMATMKALVSQIDLDKIN